MFDLCSQEYKVSIKVTICEHHCHYGDDYSYTEEFSAETTSELRVLIKEFLDERERIEMKTIIS
jgi:hypothetical protein